MITVVFLCCEHSVLPLDLLWSAPEVISTNGKRFASKKADVYSFGVILYELIGKQGPFGKSYHYTDEAVRGII